MKSKLLLSALISTTFMLSDASAALTASMLEESLVSLERGVLAPTLKKQAEEVDSFEAYSGSMRARDARISRDSRHTAHIDGVEVIKSVGGAAVTVLSYIWQQAAPVAQEGLSVLLHKALIPGSKAIARESFSLAKASAPYIGRAASFMVSSIGSGAASLFQSARNWW